MLDYLQQHTHHGTQTQIWVVHATFGGQTGLQQSTQTQRPILGPTPLRTQKYLPLSPRPKSWLGPPNCFTERGKKRSRVRSSPCRRCCSSAPPRVPRRNSHLGSSAGVVLACPDDRESFTGGDICSESFAGGEICTELPKYGFTDLVCQSTDLESRRYGFTELVCQSTDLVC